LDLGAIASASKLIKKAKTHKGRKILDKKAPQLVEGKKVAIFVKGQKASAIIQNFLRDLITLRGEPESSRVFMRNGHDMLPFDNIVPLESMASKQDCALFCFGHTQKKRPDNLIFGRTFDGKCLDIFEMGVENYQSIQDFAAKAPQDVSRDLKPVLLFQGEYFDFSEKHQRLKNILYEMFHQRDLKEANILELRRVLVFTAVEENTIQVRHYEVNGPKNGKLSEAGVQMGDVEFKEIGPRADLKLRRQQIASTDLYKAACRKPKVANVEKKKARKNVYTNELGERRGKVYIQQQDLQTMATRKFRKQGPPEKQNIKKNVDAEDV
jgi:ribosome production factor 2